MRALVASERNLTAILVDVHLSSSRENVESGMSVCMLTSLYRIVSDQNLIIELANWLCMH